ncbi:MAG: adenine-specific DNA-methyltransferase [Pirellulales bacterium]|nr:adenine-specific DNA-methyltransferase [Pirellulales bacterium]
MSKIQVFQRNQDTIFWGDAITVLEKDIPDASVSLIFADPPYNLGKKFSKFVDRWPSEAAYVEWCKQWLDLCIRKLTDAGSLYLMASTQCMPYLDIFLRGRLTVLSRIAWYYDSSGVQAKKYYGSIYEPILFCVKDPENYVFNSDAITVEARTGAQRKLIDYRKPKPALYNSQKVPGNVWYFPRVRYRMAEYENHPSQKPEALLERIVKASSNPGDIVLDPFSGTFTTSAVAQRLGRTSIGIEIQEEYVKVGLRRLGITEEFNGARLRPPQKTCVRKNGVKQSKMPARCQGELFSQ